MITNGINNNPAFCGKPILKTSVLKKVQNAYSNADAHIVELDFNNPSDYKAADNLQTLWKGEEFLPMMLCSKTNESKRVFVLTSQDKDFENMDSSKILGIVDFFLYDKTADIKFLQADTNIIKQKNREIKGIGSSLIKGVCEYFKGLGFEEMQVFSRITEKPFYKKVFPNIQDRISTKDNSANLVVKL